MIAMRASVLLMATSSVTAAASALTCESKTPTTAEYYTVEDKGTYKIIDSTLCNEKYVLYPRGSTPPALGTDYKYFGVPLQKVALTTTVPATFVESVGARSAIKVGSQYSTSACIAKLVEDGDAQQLVASWSDATLHEALVGDADADIEAIVSDPYTVVTTGWSYPATASKVICSAETWEKTPLGGAEWIKFWGYFFDEIDQATQAYCATGSRYSCNSIVGNSITLDAAKMATSTSHTVKVPTAVFAGTAYGGGFNILFTPYKNRIINDAGAVYPDFTAFEAFRTIDATGGWTKSFLFPAANVSSFHAALALADVIIDETYPNGQTLASTITNYEASSANIPALSNSRVFTLDGTMDSKGAPYGGTDYFESRVAEPDAMLADLVAVLHPGNSAPNQITGLSILRHAESGTVAKVTSSQCTNPLAARPIRAPTCAALSSTSNAVFDWLKTFDSQSLGQSTSDGDDMPTWGVAIVAVLAVLVVAISAGAVVVAMQAKKVKAAMTSAVPKSTSAA